MTRARKYWIALWREDSRLDGHKEHPINEACRPLLFDSRADARAWIAERYGYLRDRPDLRAEPHGWKMPKAVRATVTVDWS